MTEPISRDIAELREWLVRIDTKMDYMNEVKRTAEEAKTTADRALQKTDDHTEDIAKVEREIETVEGRMEKKIDGIGKTAKWAIGLTITAFLSLGGLILAVFG